MINEDLGDLDQFVMRSGVVQGGKLGDTARKYMMEDAVLFYRAGGVLSTQDWFLMSETTKGIYASAREVVEGERIAVLAAMLGAQAPRKRRNPTAPENINEYRKRIEDEEADAEEQRAISEFLDKVTS